MPYPSPSLRAGTLPSRRIALPILTMLLLAVSVLHSPSPARGDFVSNTASVSAPYGDDVNTSTLDPYPLTPVSTITYEGHPELTGQCAWINAGLDKWIKDNPGWSYKWAGVDKEAAVEKGISLVPYKYDDGTGEKEYSGYNPFVVTQPVVKGANDFSFPSNVKDRELGGAVINLRYTKQEGVDIPNLRWIQAYTGSIWGTDFGPILDNGGDPYKTQDNSKPAYYVGEGYSSGKLGGDGGYFEDRPLVTEMMGGGEYEGNPVVSAQFQVVLADYDTTNKKITLYGGEWWGYTYTAVETPEPSSCLLMAFGGCGLLFVRRVTRRMCAA